MDLQPPSASSILARRGIPRPVLKRNDSSFTAAISRADADQEIDISKALEVVDLDPSQKDVLKRDLNLVKQLRSEQIPETPSIEKIPVLTTPNRYASWECGFDMKMPAYTPSVIPNKPKEFMSAVKGELKTTKSIIAGLLKFIEVISSREHHVFSDDFLSKQSKATNTTISQLEEITEHLNELVEQVEQELENEKENPEDGETIGIHLREAFGHAKPWIARTRAVLINSHVFYKINYGLAADTKLTKK